MALQILTNATWDMNHNGFLAKLKIVTNAAGALLAGSTLDNTPIQGIYDANAQKITFLVGTGATARTYTGFLSLQSVNVPPGGQFLAGSFVAFSGPGITPPRTEYPWYATV
jgi:hypothetical protein